MGEFVGSPKIDVLPGEVDPARGLNVLGQALEMAVTAPVGPVHVCFRPEHLSVSRTEGTAATLVHRENLGSELFLHVGLADDGPRLVVRGGLEAHGALSIGDALRIGVTPDRALIFSRSGERLRSEVRRP